MYILIVQTQAEYQQITEVEREEAAVPPQPAPPPAMAMNWSYFKLEFSGKLEEGPEAHILRVIDWMDTHNIDVGIGVQRLPLALTGEGKIWYQSIHPCDGNWEELQEIQDLVF